MTTYKTEEEQIAALKNWWKENGNSLLMGIGAALAIIFGWKAYQNSVEQDKTEASMMYQELISAATEMSFSTEEDSTIEYLSNQLKENFEDSEYSIYAAMFLAKESASKGDLDGALNHLDWAKSNTEDVRLQNILIGRYARILSAQGKHDDALAMLVATDEQFKAAFLEIKGDIHKRKGEEEAAATAYTEAFTLIKENPQALPLLAVKLADLGVNPETL